MAAKPPDGLIHAYREDNRDERFRSWCAKILRYDTQRVLPFKNRQNQAITCLECLEAIVEQKAVELDRAKRTHDVSTNALAHLRASLFRDD